MAGTHRPLRTSATFAADVVRESANELIIPVPLNEEELAHYKGFYAYRRAIEWRHGELLVLAELSRLSVKIEAVSRQLSQASFEDDKLLTQYERLCRSRDGLRRQVNLNIAAMTAKTMVLQKIAADELLDGLHGKNSMPHSNAPAKIDWESALNV